MVAGSGMVLDDQTPFFNWRHETERIPGFEIVPAPGTMALSAPGGALLLPPSLRFRLRAALRRDKSARQACSVPQII
jgi:hypothetical protein